MPLRTAIDSGFVDADDAVLVGARELDPPEREFIASSGIHIGIEAVEAALAGTAGAYVALDCDVLDPEEIAVFMPEPDRLSLREAEAFLRSLRDRTEVLGLGLSGLAPKPENVEPLTQLCSALGF
jgi:arginase